MATTRQRRGPLFALPMRGGQAPPAADEIPPDVVSEIGDGFEMSTGMETIQDAIFRIEKRESERVEAEEKREEERIKARTFWIRAAIAFVLAPLILQLVYVAIAPSSFTYCYSRDEDCIRKRDRKMMEEASSIVVREQNSSGLFKLRIMFLFNKDLVDFPEYDNRRLLSLAECFGNKAASWLLREVYGAAVSLHDDFGKTVIQDAEEEHCRETRESKNKLHGGDAQATEFMWKCHDGNLDEILDALKGKPSLLSALDYDNRQCLHLLAKYNYFSIAERLFEKYADNVHLKADRHGKTAIDVAEDKGFLEMAELLRRTTGQKRDQSSY